MSTENNPSTDESKQCQKIVDIPISQDANEIQCEDQRLQSRPTVASSGVSAHKNTSLNPLPERPVEVEDGEQQYAESSLKAESHTDHVDTECALGVREVDEGDTAYDEERDMGDDEETEEDFEGDVKQDGTDELAGLEDISINSEHDQLEPTNVNSPNFDEHTEEGGFHQLDLPTSADKRPVKASEGQQVSKEIALNRSQNKPVTDFFHNVSYGTEVHLQQSAKDKSFIGGIVLNNKWAKAVITIKDYEVSFDILEKLGKGAQGVCFKVRDRDTQREYCAKEVPNEPEYYEWNEVEVMVILIGVEGFPQIYGVVKESSFVYILMEFLPGGDMNAWIELLSENKRGLRLVLDVFHQLYKRILALSKRGLSHTDINEGNVIIYWKLVNGEAVVTAVHLIDYGFATERDPDGTKRDVKLTTLCLRRVLKKIGVQVAKLPNSFKEFLKKGEKGCPVEEAIKDLKAIIEDRNEELFIDFDEKELPFLDRMGIQVPPQRALIAGLKLKGAISKVFGNH